MKYLLTGLVFLLTAFTTAEAEEPWQTAAAWREALEGALQSSEDGAGEDRRVFAALHMSMFSAGNHVDPRFEPLFSDLPAAAGDPEQAAALAAATYIRRVVGDSDAVDDLLSEAFAGTDPTDLQPLADTIVSKVRAKAAATVGEVEYWVPEPLPGRYAPTEPPVTMDAVHLAPFALPGRDAVRPEGPPALDSDVYARDWDEVRRLGGRGPDTERTLEQTKEAMFWYAPKASLVLKTLMARRDLDLLEEARIGMLFEMALQDAALASEEAKNHFMFWRPIIAIRRADLDGRPDTEIDAGWLPLMRTPRHPEYICGHCQFAAASARVWERLLPLEAGETITVTDEKDFGVNAFEFWIAQVDPDLIAGMSVTLSSYDEYSTRMSDARIYAGAHFRTSNDHGEALGRAAADIVIDQIATPLD